MKIKIQLLILFFILLSQVNIFAKYFKGAEYRTKLSYTYGRFEVRMKSSYREGMLSSFFTYYDGGGGVGNWNEIDIEIMGRYFDEKTVFRMAYTLEQKLDLYRQHPAI